MDGGICIYFKNFWFGSEEHKLLLNNDTPMELKDFVKKVIIDLDQAVSEANAETKRESDKILGIE